MDIRGRLGDLGIKSAWTVLGLGICLAAGVLLSHYPPAGVVLCIAALEIARRTRSHPLFEMVVNLALVCAVFWNVDTFAWPLVSLVRSLHPVLLRMDFFIELVLTMLAMAGAYARFRMPFQAAAIVVIDAFCLVDVATEALVFLFGAQIDASPIALNLFNNYGASACLLATSLLLIVSIMLLERSGRCGNDQAKTVAACLYWVAVPFLEMAILLLPFDDLRFGRAGWFDGGRLVGGIAFVGFCLTAALYVNRKAIFLAAALMLLAMAANALSSGVALAMCFVLPVLTEVLWPRTPAAPRGENGQTEKAPRAGPLQS